MIKFEFPFLYFTEKGTRYNLQKLLKDWTEIPLTTNEGYDISEYKPFDKVFGELLRQVKDNINLIDEGFLSSWKYQGKLYRVIHEQIMCDTNGNYRSVMPSVDYHGIISHWTDDYTFKGLTYKLAPDEKYIILEADTDKYYAFDINRFRKRYGCEEPYTEKEREYIFPMYKECIAEYYMSINEFADKKKKGML